MVDTIAHSRPTGERKSSPHGLHNTLKSMLQLGERLHEVLAILCLGKFGHLGYQVMAREWCVIHANLLSTFRDQLKSAGMNPELMCCSQVTEGTGPSRPGYLGGNRSYVPGPFNHLLLPIICYRCMPAQSMFPVRPWQYGMRKHPSRARLSIRCDMQCHLHASSLAQIPRCLKSSSDRLG